MVAISSCTDAVSFVLLHITPTLGWMTDNIMCTPFTPRDGIAKVSCLCKIVKK